VFVSRFLRNAEQILSAAVNGARPDLTILLCGQRGIRVVADMDDWSLESLRRETGAAAAYQVRRQGEDVVVEGRSGPEQCLLRRKLPATVLRELLPDRRNYDVIGPAQCGKAARMLLT
jgi:hypothetical protein